MITLMSEHGQSRANPWLATRTRSGAEYDAPYEQRAKAGMDIHGEANLVEKLLTRYRPIEPQESYSVLDAGCGTGRMAIELARRGVEVVGVDLDEVMLSRAKTKAPELRWELADLSKVSLHRRFDAIVLAGNVMIFVTPGTEAAVLKNMANHLDDGGLLLAAFELTPRPWSQLTIEKYEDISAAVGLSTVARWSTWEQAAWKKGDHYVVSLHKADLHRG